MEYEKVDDYFIFWYGKSCVDKYFDNNGLIPTTIEIAKKEKLDYNKNFLVFKGLTANKAIFVGSYKLKNVSTSSERYDMVEIYKIEIPFNEYANRLTVKFPLTSTFYYKDADRFIIEAILPKDGHRTVPVFTNYSDLDLSYLQLKEIVKYEYEDYVKPLMSVKGIYGRFCSYANTGHGGNLELKKLCKSD